MIRLTILLTTEQKDFLENKRKEMGLSKGAIIRILIGKFMKEGD